MQFEFHNPTKIVFGAGKLSTLGEIASGYGKRALVVTGGGSVKRSGVFDRAVESMKKTGGAGFLWSGIEPNPRITSVARGAESARAEKCDVVVALGGGSTMDASKVIAAAALYEGDPWDLIMHGQAHYAPPVKALPIITVPTLAATGSEANCGAVISNDATKIKSFVSTECLYPKVAIVDPELTLSVPKDQTAYGVCDLITHVTEGYFSDDPGHTPLQDRFAEGVILTALEYGPRVVANGNDLEARAQIQWAALVALVGWVQAGASKMFPVHMIEHAVSAHHNITHGAGLSIVNPAWMRFAAQKRPARFAQFAERIFGVTRSGKDDGSVAREGIDKFEAFLKSIHCSTRFSEVGIDDKLFGQFAEDSMLVATDGQGHLLANPPMSKDDIVGVLRAAL